MFSPQEPEARDSSAPETVRSFMVNWVMEHADSRVTRTQAERIVAEVYKTEHPMLLLAIFKKESQFWPRAKSYADCRGLGQVNPIHLAELKAAGIVRDIDDLYRIGPNVRASDFVLRQKLAMAKGNNLKAFDLYLSERSESYRAAVVDAYVELSSGVFRLQGGLDERERRNG
jgi:soluble lytic murein transglycosylase-like protein